MLRRLSFAALLAGALAINAATLPLQEDRSVSPGKVERKNRVPVSKDVLRVMLPKPTETTLSNGVTVLTIEDHRLPLISVQYNISGAGGLYEPADLPGLAGITATMLREGTKTRKSVDIAEETETLGARINASSGFGSAVTTVRASGLSDNFEKWFDLANDILLNPSFPADELQRLKERTKLALRQQRTQSGFLLSERFSRAVYGSHPAATVSATPASVDAMTPQTLADWHRERYTPQNTILGITGDVHTADLIAKLEKSLAGWKKTEMKEVLPANPKPVAAKKVYLVDRPGSVQTSLIMGNIAIDRRDPDYIPLTVMNHVLGGGAASRLFLNLREDKGYTYGARSSFTALKYPGAWRAFADVRTEVTDGAMTEFFREIQRMRDQRVPENELEDAKRAIVASFALSLEDPDELLSYAVVRKIYDFPTDYWDTYPMKVMAVSGDDVQRLARKYLNLDNIQVVAVGDASKIRPVMEKYGPLEVYDAEGKKIGN